VLFAAAEHGLKKFSMTLLCMFRGSLNFKTGWEVFRIDEIKRSDRQLL